MKIRMNDGRVLDVESAVSANDIIANGKGKPVRETATRSRKPQRAEAPKSETPAPSES